MKAIINGEEREVRSGQTLAGLLSDLGVQPQAIAVARNEQVVRRSELQSEQIEEGDRIEIIRAVAGG